ncbi:hypothetical protein JY651_10245 [Pyxidicoccus parkwayensis]|uniref:Secreted protein n=1 Tax=Pyxidicoccus parkwayensis TaxID=2813578 RepID=A0ABX7P4C5_9BACT|nr:hypothetical protein [Pyxidicoccus parkwaysis]QSQ25275.1 hypothetical protein JY651_10245 [Pyxidicoccus parkwaysis]
MNRKLPVLLVFSLGLASVASAQPARPTEHKSPTPAWLPRGVFLGATVREGAVTPRVKVQWQLTFFQDRKDAFALLLEGGLGWAASFPARDVTKPQSFLGSYYEHTAQVGVGYRNQLPDSAHWGFQVTGGPVFYGAHFDGGAPADHRTTGIVEGRIHLGYQFGAVGAGAAIGYSEPFSLKKRSLGRYFVGGPMFGLFMDWR